MLDQYKILTVTHHNVKLDALGQFAVQVPENLTLEDHLQTLKQELRLDELLYMPTCNRITYFFTSEQALSPSYITNFFKKVNPALGNYNEQYFHDRVQALDGEQAIKHLFEVAASINSLVVGEREILRQLREAYEKCKNWGLTDDSIRLAVQKAVESAKNIYANTRIGEKPISVVSLAFEKLQLAQLPKDKRILLIGAGQTNTLFGKFLKKYGYTNVTIFNRTFSKAVQLIELIEGEARAFSYDSLEAYRGGFDCLVVCTGAQKPIVTEKLFRSLLKDEDSNDKLVIDLAIPHNVDKSVVQNFDFNYVEIEGLRQSAEKNLEFRRQEVEHARELVHDAVFEFESIYQERQIERAMRVVPKEIKQLRSRIFDNVFKEEVDALDIESRSVLEKALAYMEKKCISISMRAAKAIEI